MAVKPLYRNTIGVLSHGSNAGHGLYCNSVTVPTTRPSWARRRWAQAGAGRKRALGGTGAGALGGTGARALGVGRAIGTHAGG